MAKRKRLSKKFRFEVFKRDSFTCQYCGRSAPAVVLHADHIQPVSKDGSDDILNLITSCIDCNLGKKDRLLSDDSAIQKQKAQLDELNERREQLEMMIRWRTGLSEIGDREVEIACAEWKSVTRSYHLNDSGIVQLKKFIKKFSLQAVLDGMQTSATYLETDSTGNYTHESVDRAFKKVPGICYTLSLPEHEQKLIHVRNIARKRAGGWWSQESSAELLSLLIQAYSSCCPIESFEEEHVVTDWPFQTLKALALKGFSYTRITDELRKFIDEYGD